MPHKILTKYKISASIELIKHNAPAKYNAAGKDEVLSYTRPEI